MRKDPITVMEKTVGVVTDRNSASNVLLFVRMTSDRDKLTVSVEYNGTKITIPYGVIDELKQRINGV